MPQRVRSWLTLARAERLAEAAILGHWIALYLALVAWQLQQWWVASAAGPVPPFA